ncbi:MAG: glutamate mutase L [Anaerolineales bacterium]|nr:glutamate mutase L [Anaerolineales bacterium]
MTNTSLIDADTLLAVDVGAVNTRALLFDSVEGRYRFLAAGNARTTAGAPMYDTSEGVRFALDQLREISGRLLVGADERLIAPSTDDGAGVDQVATTFSAGAPLKVVGVGLLENVSLESVRHLVQTSYTQMIETIGLNDRRKVEEQVDAILRLRPDAIIISGGTNDGASRSVLKLVNAVGMALYLLPKSNRPEVLFVGNTDLTENVTNFLQPLTTVRVASNVRPDLKVEQIGPAEYELAQMFKHVHTKRIMGVEELDIWAGGNLMPTSAAFGRIIRFLSSVSDDAVLGVDVGASSTTVAAAFARKLKLNVYPQMGVGEGLTGILNNSKLDQVYRWIAPRVPETYVLDYLYNKRLYPATLPATEEDLAIEQAVAREAVRYALRQSDSSFPKDIERPQAADTIPWFNFILVGGNVIARAPSLAQSMLMILDAIQPTGVSRVLLDKNALTPALGAAAVMNSILAVQVLESTNSYVYMGTTICPVGKARPGTPVLQLRVRYDTGQEKTYEVNQGTIQLIPLPLGRMAQVQLQPLQRTDIGWGPGKGGTYPKKIFGGAFGLVVDARGRPLELPNKPEERRNTLQKWLFSLQR